MLNRLSTFYILTNHLQNLDDTDLGFPYCIMMYNLAFLANLVVFTLYVIENNRDKNNTSDITLNLKIWHHTVRRDY